MDPTRIASSSSQPDQVLSPHTPGNSVASAAGEGSFSVRGLTRGLKVAKLPCHPNFNPSFEPCVSGQICHYFCDLLGEAVRVKAPVRKEGWKSVHEGIKSKFLSSGTIKAAVDAKCQKLYRDWKCDLHTHYLSLLEAGVPDPKSHPL